MCKLQELCTHINHMHVMFDLLTYQRMRMMDTHVGPIVDIHAQLIIHELHCAWISLFSLRLTEEVECTEEIFSIHTLACVCVSNGQWHPRWMIHIHSVHLCHAGNGFWCMLDHWDSWCCSLRPVNRQRGGLRGWDRGWAVRDVGQREGGQSRDLAVVSVISYLERQTLGTPLQ